MRPLALLLAGLAWVLGPPCGSADEPTPQEMASQAVRAAFEGRWDDALRSRQAWYSSTHGLGQLDTRGAEIVRWRPWWEVEADGRFSPPSDLEDDSALAAIAARLLLDPTFDLARSMRGAAPFEAVEMLWYERVWRETHGMGKGPQESPLKLVPDPDGLVSRFLGWQREVYEPTPQEQSPDAAWAAKARTARELADSLRSTSRLWAILSAGLLLALALVLGLRLRPSRPGT